MITAGEVIVYSDGPAKIIIAVVIIMALWGQKIRKPPDDKDH